MYPQENLNAVWNVIFVNSSSHAVHERKYFSSRPPCNFRADVDFLQNWSRSNWERGDHPPLPLIYAISDTQDSQHYIFA